MPVGSHKDAFKAHQYVKKLVSKDSNSSLAVTAADILLDFLKNQRQINSEKVIPELPNDPRLYDQEILKTALTAVGSLCGQCEEAHNNGCFVNQARRVLIAAKTGIDLGIEFDGKKNLETLLAEAERLASEQTTESKNSIKDVVKSDEKKVDSELASLTQELESYREKDIFRRTLIDEVVQTIQKVSDGKFASEMPVHDDEQLGKLATAFNIMLKAIQTTMSHLDQLVNERNAELKQIMNTVPVGLLSLTSDYLVKPEYSRSAEIILRAEGLRGRDFLDVIGLTRKREAERKLFSDYLSFLQLGILGEAEVSQLNPFPEILLPSGKWVRMKQHLLASSVGKQELLVELEDITQEKRLAEKADEAKRESAQIKAIAEAPDTFREFLSDINQTIAFSEKSIETLAKSDDPKEKINSMFRFVHTIKGVAGSFGMNNVAKTAEVLENLLSQVREKQDFSPDFFKDMNSGLLQLSNDTKKTWELAKSILGEEQETGPLMRIPLDEIKELAVKVKENNLSDNLINILSEKLSHFQKIPAKKAFERTIRLIPGLIARLEKEVQLIFSGGETPVHYDLARELNPVLVHIIRNAFDHGIEDVEERLTNEKPQEGKISITVKEENGFLEIAVEDDGKGLDPEILRSSAVRKSLLSLEAAKNLTLEQCRELIFLPGFSTAEIVTDISGRGVGMDAVAFSVKKLGGKIKIDSIVKQYTRFTIQIPLEK
ncbi:MAG: Hpt domain-containing protein [Candidatus Riflebacteria bacterium]|nr:Hpt domain-containing protein [Candidatus Riflebacteria bacterium]